MFKIEEDNTYNDIREKSLMSWLAGVQDTGSYIDACGAKLAVEYIQYLKEKIEILEEKNRIVKIIGLIIGLLVLGAGICYLVKEKQDPESRKIYTVVSVIVGVIAAVCAVLLFV